MRLTLIQSKDSNFDKFKIILLVFGLMFLFWPTNTNAASLTSISDVMTRQKIGTASSHTITFSIGGSTTLDANETIVIDFHEDDSEFVVGGAATVVGDLDITVGGTDKNLVDIDGACAGHAGATDMVAQVNDSTGVLIITACGSFTSSAAGAIISVEYGTAATTGGMGVNRITNPGTTGSYIVDITAAGDTGRLADSVITNDQVVVSTTIDPYLTFTVNQTSITLNKNGGGNPDYSNTGYNTGTANTLQATTNATTGYIIAYNGATLSANGGADTIDAMGTKTTSTTNTEQFGINLKANTTPSTGADPSGGDGTAKSDYNTANQFRFIAGATTDLASASAPSTTTTYTVSYIVNVGQTTQAGAYSTTITYICTGAF